MELSIDFKNCKIVILVLNWSISSLDGSRYISNIHTSEYQNLEWITKLSSPKDANNSRLQTNTL